MELSCYLKDSLLLVLLVQRMVHTTTGLAGFRPDSPVQNIISNSLIASALPVVWGVLRVILSFQVCLEDDWGCPYLKNYKHVDGKRRQGFATMRHEVRFNSEMKDQLVTNQCFHSLHDSIHEFSFILHGFSIEKCPKTISITFSCSLSIMFVYSQVSVSVCCWSSHCSPRIVRAN